MMQHVIMDTDHAKQIISSNLTATDSFTANSKLNGTVHTQQLPLLRVENAI